jgi:hypothetical protein
VYIDKSPPAGYDNFKIESLIKSGGGNGPMNPRQPGFAKVPNPTSYRKMRSKKGLFARFVFGGSVPFFAKFGSGKGNTKRRECSMARHYPVHL